MPKILEDAGDGRRGEATIARPGGAAMNPHIKFALDHPVFDPEKQIVLGHFWLDTPTVSVGLTCNIGLE
jgi:hypothetical protein